MFSNDLVIQILIYIENNLYKKITIDELANIFHYNKDHIMRLFKREIGYTIVDYINHKRIYNSLISFKYRKISILNISINYGFYSQEYYCEIFHKVIGVAPTTYHKFVTFKNSLSFEKINIIQTNLSQLDYKLRKIDAYLNNIPPKTTVKTLSIFK